MFYDFSHKYPESAVDLDSHEHQRFQNYKFEPLVLRLKVKLKISEEESRKLFSDLMTWMYLCTVSEEPLSPPKMVDEAWHNFILCTEQYAKFCHEFCGHFVHHVPHELSDTQKNVNKQDILRQQSKSLFVKLGLTSKNWQMGLVGSPCSTCKSGTCCSISWYCKLQNSDHKTVAIF